MARLVRPSCAQADIAADRLARLSVASARRDAGASSWRSSHVQPYESGMASPATPPDAADSQDAAPMCAAMTDPDGDGMTCEHCITPGRLSQGSRCAAVEGDEQKKAEAVVAASPPLLSPLTSPHQHHSPDPQIAAKPHRLSLLAAASPPC
ncbi:hypothetical protein BDV96DRAFT_598323 [Lophiotrema nucula]|uniref:Uncharacterized protein n=1 Tax=Lophiotrema nucula TaxID=690887 RepID=A0A6A5ZDA2_9PLEO|nr:hypothetical protein BDV96DRAFT_598323 [Lophiotrema nucula]